MTAPESRYVHRAIAELRSESDKATSAVLALLSKIEHMQGCILETLQDENRQAWVQQQRREQEQNAPSTTAYLPELERAAELLLMRSSDMVERWQRTRRTGENLVVGARELADLQKAAIELSSALEKWQDWKEARQRAEQRRPQAADLPGPAEIALCGGPCETIGPEACDCRGLKQTVERAIHEAKPASDYRENLSNQADAVILAVAGWLERQALPRLSSAYRTDAEALRGGMEQ
jgi:hypothetical protein